MRRLQAVTVLVLLAVAAPAVARPPLPPPQDAPARPPGAPPLLPPVDGPIGRRFTPPETDFGPGHRGVDFAAPPGTRVRAAAAGVVTFAGRVGSVVAVTVVHRASIATTYSTLGEVFVAEGDPVRAGEWVGTVAVPHLGGEGGVHFGVKVSGEYVDPEAYLGPLDVAGAIYLVKDAPVHGNRFAPGSAPPRPDDRSRDCIRAVPPSPGAPPPTDNLALVVGGFNAGADAPVFALPARLGYAPRDVYRFSYRGLDGPRFFEPYTRGDTYGRLAEHALRLRHLLRRIGTRHPGRAVDVFAHSQGGLIARDALARLAEEWDPAAAHVEHLVTLAAPHGGTDAVTARDILEGGTLTLAVLEGVRAAGALDPWAAALDDMAPGSPYLEALAAADVTLGTRGLALAMPHDVVVPAHRARWDGELSRTVPPTGLFGHGAVVASPQTDAIAYAFLRGTTPCAVADGLGDDAGKVVAAAQRVLPVVVRGAEEAAKESLSRRPLGRLVVEVAETVALFRRR